MTQGDLDKSEADARVRWRAARDAVLARELLQAIEHAEKTGEDAVQVVSKGRGSWVLYGADPEDAGMSIMDPDPGVTP